MSYSEEKIRVLSMLQEGKITAEEAARLLEALDGGAASEKTNAYQGSYQSSYQSKQKQNEFTDEINKMKEKLNSWKKDFKENFDQKDFDKVVEEVTTKAEKVGKNVAVATVGVVDRVLDYVGSFVDTSMFNVFSNYNAVEKVFEANANEVRDIDIQAVNGTLVVKKHLDDKIIIRAKIRSAVPNPDAVLSYTEENGSIVLKVNDLGNMSVSYEVFLPQFKFGNLRFVTSNAKIYVEDTKSESFETITKNSHIELMGVNAEDIKVYTKNGKLQLTYVIGKKIDVNTNNSLIDIRHVKAEEINAETTNGRILLENMQNADGVEEAKINLRTTNGGIKVAMNDMNYRGYKFKGRTSIGGINLLIPELTYHNVNRSNMSGSFVEAESLKYEQSSQKVSIVAETNNGGIEVAQ